MPSPPLSQQETESEITSQYSLQISLDHKKLLIFHLKEFTIISQLSFHIHPDLVIYLLNKLDLVFEFCHKSSILCKIFKTIALLLSELDTFTKQCFEFQS